MSLPNKIGVMVSDSILDVESLPCAAAVWGLEHKLLTLNHMASELIGFSIEELKEPGFWLQRVDRRDRQLLIRAWKKAQNGESKSIVDYRFFPQGSADAIWLREMSISYRSVQGEVSGFVSIYTDITDLSPSGRRDGAGIERNVGKVLRNLTHDIQNNLQAIRMEIDLLQLDATTSLDLRRIFHAIDRANLSIQDLNDYFVPPELLLSQQNPEIILEEVLEQMSKELSRQGIAVHVTCQTPLPLVSVDSRQFRGALERVLTFCKALLNEGGELDIGVSLKETRKERHVELKFASSSRSTLDMDEKEVFRPFLRVKNYRAGLGMALADQILQRHHGKISFQKDNPNRGTFTILLDAR